MNKIKIGIAGVGRIGKIHLENILQKFPDVHIALVADPLGEAEEYVLGKNLKHSKHYADVVTNKEMESFFRSVRNDEEVIVSWSDGLKAMEIALAAKRSIKENRPVLVDEID